MKVDNIGEMDRIQKLIGDYKLRKIYFDGPLKLHKSLLSVACGPSFSQKDDLNPEKREMDILETIDKLIKIEFPLDHRDKLD